MEIFKSYNAVLVKLFELVELLMVLKFTLYFNHFNTGAIHKLRPD